MKLDIKLWVRFGLCFLHAYKHHKFYSKILKDNKLKHIVDGKKKWIKKWSVFGLKVDPVYYDVFAHYMSDDVNIVPENICHDIIERILNPVCYDGYYSDKNNFDKLFPDGVLPITIFRKINGFYFGADYKPMRLDEEELKRRLDNSGFGQIVIKPTLESCSGHGVKVAIKEHNKWIIIGEDQLLTFGYLQNNYGSDFIVQEGMRQCDYINQFNSTSVNTLRLTVYRSVRTNECVVTSAIMRIGKKGKIIDNAHAGGGFIALNLDGTLGNKVFNQYGNSCAIFNDVDFSQHHQIPDFNRVIQFAKSVGECILNHRLIALDVMIDKSGLPKLIEFNTGTASAYGMWLFQYVGMSAFGNYTDEIIDYCKQHINEARQLVCF